MPTRRAFCYGCLGYAVGWRPADRGRRQRASRGRSMSTAAKLSALTHEFTAPLPSALRFYAESAGVSGFATATTLSTSSAHVVYIADYADQVTGGVLGAGA